MAYSALSVVQIEENRRDIAGGRAPRHTGEASTPLPSAPAGTTGTDGWDTDADRDTARNKINGNAARVTDLENALIDFGWLV